MHCTYGPQKIITACSCIKVESFSLCLFLTGTFTHIVPHYTLDEFFGCPLPSGSDRNLGSWVAAAGVTAVGSSKRLPVELIQPVLLCVLCYLCLFWKCKCVREEQELVNWCRETRKSSLAEIFNRSENSIFLTSMLVFSHKGQKGHVATSHALL